MAWRARIILIVVWVLSLAAVATWGRGQTPSEQKLNAFIENLRGRVSEATFENGRYRHAGIAFDVPADWEYGGTVPDENPADDTAHWRDPQSGVSVYVWLSLQKTAPEDVATLIAGVVANKTRQREHQGIRRWHIRPENVQQTSAGGHSAVVAVADFESRSGGPRVERLTWIFTPESRVLFFATMSPDQLPTFSADFDRIVQSVSLP
jgi:hypothetical protein